MLPVEQLKAIPLFAELNEEELAHLAPLFHHARYAQGDVVTRQGEACDAFFVLENGTLRVQDLNAGEPDPVPSYLTAPAFVGEATFFSDGQCDATIQVVSAEANLSVLTRQEFEQLARHYPGIRERLVTSLDMSPAPAQASYPWLSEGEVVLINTRRHWYALLPRLLRPLFFTLALLIAWVLLQAFQARFASVASGQVLGMIDSGLLILAVAAFFGGIMWEALDWSNDYYFVTNKRVIHIEKTIFLYDEREEAPIEMVTNVVELSQGFAPRIFGFVDLRVETAGRQVEINFDYAPRSALIRQTIFEQMSQMRDRGAAERRERVRAGIRQQLRQRLAPDGSGLAGGGDSASTPADVAETMVEEPVQSVRVTGLGKFLRSAFALRVDEPHQVTWHKHWFNLLDRLLKPLVALAILLVLGAVQASGSVPVQVANWIGDPFLGRMLLGAVWIILVCLAVFGLWYQYEDWNNDLYRVTTDRVVDVERSPFGFSERSVETTLDRVQDISYVQHGPLQVLFNYGDVFIETAGAGRLVFYTVENPRAATQEIFRRREAHRAALQTVEAQQERNEFLDWFVEYHQLLKERGDMNRSDPPPFRESPPNAEPPSEPA
jgi:uncharacterized membrane protein YdbT with pleckstrin-like domain